MQVTGSAKRYAECLVTLAALRRPPERTVPVLAAVSRSRLHQRVARIMAAPRATMMRPWRALAVGSALGLAACALAVGNVHVATSAVASAVGITAPPATAAVAVPISSTEASLEPTASVSRAVPGNRQVRARATVAARETAPSEDAGTAYRDEEPATTAIVSLPGSALGAPPGATASEPLARLSSGPVEHPIVPAAPPVLQDLPRDASAGWARAADVGVAIGRASQTAGVSTAGFFRRFAKKVAGSF